MRGKMHITPLRSHRLLVVLPAFLLVCTLSLREGVEGPAVLSQVAAVEQTEDSSVTVVPGVFAMLQAQGAQAEYSDASGLSLESGMITVASQGRVSVVVGPLMLSGLSGAFQVSREAETVTIAALTSPVLIDDGLHRAVVPVHMQWRMALTPALLSGSALTAGLQPLPAHFLQTALPQAQKLLLRDSAIIPPQDHSLPIVSLLQFAEAEERAQEDSTVAQIGAFAEALASGDRERIDTAFLYSEDVLRSAMARPILPRLLSRASLQGKGSLILPLLLEDPTDWMLASFHPILRDYSWVLPRPLGATAEDQILRLFLLPLSDTLTESLSPLAFAEWQRQWEETLRQSSRPVFLLQMLVPMLQERIATFTTMGYFDRAKRYESATLALLNPYRSLLPQDLQQTVDALRKVETVEIPLPTVPEIVSSSSSQASAQPSQVSPEAGQALDATARSYLRDAGFMLTTQTILTPLTSADIHIEHIALGTPQGDRVLEFTLRLTAEGAEAMDIVLEGNTYPYPLPLEKFVEWVKVQD